MLLLCLPAQSALAQTVGELHLSPPPDLGEYQSRRIDEVRVESEEALWRERVELKSVRPGDLPAALVVRRGMRELAESASYAEIRAELIDDGSKLVLVYWVRARRLVRTVRITGSVIADEDTRRALSLEKGDEITERSLEESEQNLIEAYRHAGYPAASVSITAEDTDEDLYKLLRIEVVSGPPLRVSARTFRVLPSPHHPALLGLLETFSIRAGDRLDEETVQDAAKKLQELLVQHRFYEAEVTTKAQSDGQLIVLVRSGPRFSLRLEGAQHFGAERMEGELKLTEQRDPRPEILEPLLRQFLVSHGFLDARVRFERRDTPDGLQSELHGWIREGKRFAVTERFYPCLGQARSRREMDQEVQGVLGEQFPGLALIGPPNGRALDDALTGQDAGTRATPLPAAHYESFSREAYTAARLHLQDLLRSEGYLDAEVGPITLVRRTCRSHTQPGVCEVQGPPPVPIIDCSAPLPKPDQVRSTCTPNAEDGVRCEPSGPVVMPIRPGRQAMLYDVSLSGNVSFDEKTLLDRAKLPLGKPARMAEIEAGLQAIRDLYAEHAYAFAQVDSALELSSDRTRARLVISLVEGEQVVIERIDIRGATRTNERLIRRRLAIDQDGLYRKAAVERSQRQVDSLGTFTSVSIGMQDPGVPARRKVVVVTVTERMPQYVDIRGGFATADGFRIGFEYGHRNLGGTAIALTLRSQLALRPTALIPEADVRQRYEDQFEGSLAELLERRNTITLSFPEVGLGPLFRGDLEFLDVRDNNRDFALTRDAGVVRLNFKPQRQWWLSAGATVERNDALIIGKEKESLDDVIADSGIDIRVPEGVSLAVTQNLGGAWDRRDRALSATRGTYLGGSVEHVDAVPIVDGGANPDTCEEARTGALDPVCSSLFRFTGRVAGYVPLNKKGLAFALSLRGGHIAHLNEESTTYPDRLFFMGGVDTMRGFPQDSLVPQDAADAVLEGQLEIESVVLRGGDHFINPRVELRIPLLGSVSTALFVDAGNLWTRSATTGAGGGINLLELRYTFGTGLRLDTPVGPLVFDYGFNASRVLDAIDPSRGDQRFWEDLGAFHFSIGLF